MPLRRFSASRLPVRVSPSPARRRIRAAVTEAWPRRPMRAALRGTTPGPERAIVGAAVGREGGVPRSGQGRDEAGGGVADAGMNSRRGPPLALIQRPARSAPKSSSRGIGRGGSADAADGLRGPCSPATLPPTHASGASGQNFHPRSPPSRHRVRCGSSGGSGRRSAGNANRSGSPSEPQRCRRLPANVPGAATASRGKPSSRRTSTGRGSAAMGSAGCKFVAGRTETRRHPTQPPRA